jgi:hypothetical protein
MGGFGNRRCGAFGLDFKKKLKKKLKKDNSRSVETRDRRR